MAASARIMPAAWTRLIRSRKNANASANVRSGKSAVNGPTIDACPLDSGVIGEHAQPAEDTVQDSIDSPAPIGFNFESELRQRQYRRRYDPGGE